MKVMSLENFSLVKRLKARDYLNLWRVIRYELSF